MTAIAGGCLLVLALGASETRAGGTPAGLPSFWNNAGWAIAVGALPPLALSLGTWLSEMDDIGTSPRGMFRGAIGAADRSQAGNHTQPAMYYGLRTGSFYGETNTLGAEVNTEFFTWAIDRKVETEELDYRLEALMAFSLWRNFEYPKLTASGEEQVVMPAGTAGLTLLAGLGYVSEPGSDDRNAIPGLPVALRAHWMPYDAFGGEVELEALVNIEKLYLVTDVTLFLCYGPRSMPFTGGVQYRVVTDGEDMLHLIGVAVGGF